MSDDFDSILEAIKGPAASGGSIDPTTLMLMQMQQDRADRAASRQMMLQMVTALAPLLLPMFMGKKEADPLLMTVLQSVLGKQSNTDQLKEFMQMMAAASNMSMEQMKQSMLSIMELKDTQTKKMLEDARSGGDDDSGALSGPAAIMREIRLGLGSVVGMLPANQPAAPAAPQAALPAPGAAQPAAQNPGQRPPPIVVVLHQLQAIQTGKVKDNPATWTALSCVALQDQQLLSVLDDCSDDDLQPLLAYCLPHIKASQALAQWISTAGVPEWIDTKVRKKLFPLIDAARDDEPDDSQDELLQPPTPGDEPEELQPAEGAEG